MIFVISRMFLSKIPTVFGFVNINPAVSGPTAARSASRSAPDGMLMTWKPHIAAVAGFVPWAESGTMIFVRAVSPRSV